MHFRFTSLKEMFIELSILYVWLRVYVRANVRKENRGKSKRKIERRKTKIKSMIPYTTLNDKTEHDKKNFS